MKNKKFAKDTFTFESNDVTRQEEQDFVDLMEYNGVKPLSKQDTTQPSGKSSRISTLTIKTENVVQKNLISTHKYGGASPNEKDKGRRARKKIKISRNFKPDIRIDLHGLTRDTAIKKVEALIPRALRNNQQTILVITGKGLHSAQGEEKGVLKNAVWNYLEVLRQERKIETFRWAPPHLGGEGAILIII